MKEGFPTKRLYQYLKGSRGSSLIAVFLILTVLLVLGMGVMVLSLGSTKQAATGDTYEKLYYPAEGVTRQGVEYIRQEVLSVYNEIRDDLSKYILSSNNQTEFFNKINSYISDASTRFVPSANDLTSGAGLSEQPAVTITSSGSGITRTYRISATAKGNGVTRVVTSSIQVTFAPITFIPGKKTLAYGEQVLIVDGDIIMTDAKNGSINANGSDVLVTGEVIDNKRDVETDPGYNVIENQPLPVPLNWNLNYGDFTQPTDVTPVEYAEYGSDTLTDQTIITIGNVQLTNMTLRNCKIFCGGNLTSSNTTFANCQVFVNGSVTMTGDSLASRGSKLFMFVGGTFDFNEGTIENVIVYAKSGMKLDHGHGTAQKTVINTGLLYCAGNVLVNDYVLAGQLIVKGNYTYEGVNSRCSNDLSVQRDIDDLLSEAGFEPFDQGGLVEIQAPPTVILPDSASIFVNTDPPSEN